MNLLYLIAPLTLFISIVSFTSILKYEVWWIRSADFPRAQLCFLGILLLCTTLILLDINLTSTKIILALLVASVSYQLWWIVPYTSFFKKESESCDFKDPQNTLTILTANVLTPNRKAKKLLALVAQHQPDVLVTLESDAWWQTQLSEIEVDYPYRICCPLDNLYGMHVYAKYPLTDSTIEFLVEPDIPSIHTLLKLPSGQDIRMHFLHPAPPSPTENEASTERDVELIMVAKSVADASIPVIVTGDLNDVAWSATTRLFRKVSQLLDPRVGRGMFNTFHADHWYLRWPLDHLFHSAHFKVYSLERLPHIGSDHFPLLTTLVFDAKHALKQHEGLQADEIEHQTADDKLNENGVNERQVPKPE